MNKSMNVIIVFIVFFVMLFLIEAYLKKMKQEKLFAFLQHGEFEQFEKELDSHICIWLIPKFNREFLRMNAYTMQNNLEKLESQFELLLNMRADEKQHTEVIVRAFDYYVNSGNNQKSKMLLEEIKKMNDQNLIDNSQMMYDILIEKNFNYIEKLNNELDYGTNMEKGMKAYLISLQYGYLNNLEKEKEYQDLSKSYFLNKDTI